MTAIFIESTRARSSYPHCKSINDQSPFLKMNNKYFLTVLAIAAFAPLLSYAQDDDEEIFELSPFEVQGSENRGYRATSTLARTRVRTTSKDVGSAISVVTNEFIHDTAEAGELILTVRNGSDPRLDNATGVAIQFAIGFYDDDEKIRLETLRSLIDQVKERVESTSGFHFEPGALLVPEGDRKKSKSKRKSDYTAHGHFTVSFDFLEEGSPLKRVSGIRRIISEMDIESKVTKIFYGAAYPVTEHSDQDTESFALTYSRHSNIGATIPYVMNEKHEILAMSSPTIPVSIIKSADNVCIHFKITHYADLEKNRAKALNEFLDLVEVKAESDPKISFKPGAVTIIQGDRTGKNIKKAGAYASQAAFTITFPLGNRVEPLKQIRAVRRMLSDMHSNSEITNIQYGPANLVVKNPNQHRTEIIKAIYSDLALLKEGLGEKFEIEPNILNTRVRTARHSDTEIEFWIPYSYGVISIRERELTQTKLFLQHEVAMKPTDCTKACCHKHDKD